MAIPPSRCRRRSSPRSHEVSMLAPLPQLAPRPRYVAVAVASLLTSAAILACAPDSGSSAGKSGGENTSHRGGAAGEEGSGKGGEGSSVGQGSGGEPGSGLVDPGDSGTRGAGGALSADANCGKSVLQPESIEV